MCQYLLQVLLLANMGKVVRWDRVGEARLYALEPSLLGSFVPSNKDMKTKHAAYMFRYKMSLSVLHNISPETYLGEVFLPSAQSCFESN